MNISIVNILDFIATAGIEFVQNFLQSFSCSKNPEIEDFIRNKAVDFALKKISVTYLLVDDERNILAYFSLTHKVVEIGTENLSNTTKKRLEKFSTLNSSRSCFSASAFLIAQFGKNFTAGLNESISGIQLMDYVFSILTKAQHLVGGGLVFLECEEKSELLDFYTNSKNNFKIFGQRFSESEKVKYIQLLRFF